MERIVAECRTPTVADDEDIIRFAFRTRFTVCPPPEYVVHVMCSCSAGGAPGFR